MDWLKIIYFLIVLLMIFNIIIGTRNDILQIFRKILNNVNFYYILYIARILDRIKRLFKNY